MRAVLAALYVCDLSAICALSPPRYFCNSMPLLLFCFPFFLPGACIFIPGDPIGASYCPPYVAPNLILWAVPIYFCTAPSIVSSVCSVPHSAPSNAISFRTCSGVRLPSGLEIRCSWINFALSVEPATPDQNFCAPYWLLRSICLIYAFVSTSTLSST